MSFKKLSYKILSALIAGALFTGCFVSSTGGGAVGVNRKQIFLISAQTMDESAARAYVQTLSSARQERALNVNPVMTKRVRDIAIKLASQVGVFRQDALGWKWEVNVIDSGSLNAWCMPGGKIAVYSGIIEKLNLTDGELAAILGHEMAHALREHSREQASNDQLKNIGIFAVAQASGMGEVGANLLNLAATYGISLPFSRSHEREADRIGAELMARAGYDPNEAVNVWVKMSKSSDNAIPEILSTHPSNESRIKDLKQTVKLVYPLFERAVN